MLKYLCILLILISSVSYSFAATVDVSVDIGKEETLYRYIFKFGPDEGLTSFSFEKTPDAQVIYARDSGGTVLRYSIAGDYFIFRPEQVENKTFEIRYTSKQSSTEVNLDSSFTAYQNFNFPVESLVYRVRVSDSIGTVKEILPRSYETTEDGGIVWYIKNPKADTLFLLNFESNNSSSSFSDIPLIVYLGIGVLLFVVFLLLYLLKSKKKIKLKDLSPRKIKKPTQEDKNNEVQVENVQESKVIESFEEIIEKYLTDNEKEVVKVIKENSGISQYDILNFLPTLTKSNLSKIISKLHSRKFLNRIRVGKVNKIYLGEKLEDVPLEKNE